MSTFLNWTLSDASLGIARRTISSVELTQAVISRVELENNSQHSFISILSEDALQQAKIADGELNSGFYRGPLHGIPVAVKDLMDMAGTTTTCGASMRLKAPPSDSSAIAIQRMVNAGAIVVGKTNLHPFGYGITNKNPTFGCPPNPYDSGRTPGGSSGGSAVAVATNQCFAALGSDTGGSVRLPAAWCGIVGLKPTYGRVSRKGLFPLAWSLDQIGPMARTVFDAAVMLQAIAGSDSDDGTASSSPIQDYTASIGNPVRGLKVGVVSNWFWEDIDEEIASVCLRAVETLEQLGVKVQRVDWPFVEHAAHVLSAIIYSESATVHLPWLRQRPNEYEQDVRDRLLLATMTTAVDYIQAQRLRRSILRAALALVAEVDLLLTPTALRGPTLWSESPSGWGTHNTGPFNLTGFPAITVPIAFSSRGLPIGVQLASAPFTEALLLRVAWALERELGLVSTK